MDVVRILFADHRTELVTLLAYIDPGTGSLAFQALAATLLSGALFFKALRGAVIRLAALPFRRFRSSPREVVNDPQESVPPAEGRTSAPQRKAA